MGMFIIAFIISSTSSFSIPHITKRNDGLVSARRCPRRRGERATHSFVDRSIYHTSSVHCCGCQRNEPGHAVAVLVGAGLAAATAAELIHYGQALVKGKMTIFDILATTFTAVTYHELYKYAAIDANSKLDFGVEWQNIFDSLQLECDIDMDEADLQEKFDAIDLDGSGSLSEQEMFALFTAMGKPVGKRVISNIMRLSDPDGHGAIEFEDFKRIYYKSCGME